MPRKRVRSPFERKSDEDEDFFFDDTQSSSEAANEPVHGGSPDGKQSPPMDIGNTREITDALAAFYRRVRSFFEGPQVVAVRKYCRSELVPQNRGRSSQEPLHRNAANARERARMRVLSKAFCRLKTTLPWVPADTKLSKLDTLRLAASYIAHLRALLHDEPKTAKQMFPHPLNLAWPFAFQHGGGLNNSVSSRWSANSVSSDSSTQEIRHDCSISRDIQTYSTETYEQGFTEYGKRCYEDGPVVSNALDSGTNTMQYCNYPYKESYYEMRNLNSDSVMN